jgi:hypothetical protein
VVKNLFLIIFLFSFSALFAQVGIGTDNPHSSSILDISSTTQGVLLPRLTNPERDAIVNPTEGLLIYNVTTKDFNYFKTNWKSVSKGYQFVNESATISTNSMQYGDVTGMVITPSQGVHVISYESEISNTNLPVPIHVSANSLLINFNTLYNQLSNYSTVVGTAVATYSGGETIFPGKYSVIGPASVAGTITLDGGGNPNSIFIFKSTGALNFAAASTMVLINGAAAENIFWISDAAVGVGASSTIYGNLMSNGGAIAIGAETAVQGRLLTASGAISFGPGVCSVPANQSATIEFGNLKNFVLFTGSGAINNTGASTYNGNICSGAGDTSSLNAAGVAVNGIFVPANQTVNIGAAAIEAFTASFGIFVNDILIESTRKKVTLRAGYTSVSLGGVVTVNTGEVATVKVKWKIDDTGTLNSENRVLTSIKVH